MAITKEQLTQRLITVFGQNTPIKTAFKDGKATFSTEEGGNYTITVAEDVVQPDGNYNAIVGEDGELGFTPSEDPKEEGASPVQAEPAKKLNSNMGFSDKALF